MADFDQSLAISNARLICFAFLSQDSFRALAGFVPPKPGDAKPLEDRGLEDVEGCGATEKKEDAREDSENESFDGSECRQAKMFNVTLPPDRAGED